jgi:hypothetical protein
MTRPIEEERGKRSGKSDSWLLLSVKDNFFKFRSALTFSLLTKQLL